MLRIRDLAVVRVRYGYRRLHVLLRREGWQVNYKRVYRLYRQQGLELRLKRARKRVSVAGVPAPVPQRPNACWSMDFMSDQLADGRRIRLLTFVDTMSRESPAIEVASSLSGQRVAAVLDRLKGKIGLPKMIQVDNGPEFTSKTLDAWAHRHGVQLKFSRPGTPTDNPFIEAFNRRVRDECLSQHWFESVADAQQILDEWRQDDNERRPHTALDQATPLEFKQRWLEKQHLAG